MTSEKVPGTTWIGRDRGRVIVLWVGGGVGAGGFMLFFWPIWALTQKHPPVAGAVAYLILLAAALIWASYRLWWLGVRFDHHGVTVCNLLRTSRAAWAEVNSFTDGTTNGRSWALTVMLRDGRGVTATATGSRPGSPELLITARQAAQSHGVPAALTGVAAERPRAWLDDADESRRQGVLFAGLLAGSVLALAATVPLLWWGRSDSIPHNLGNYYPAGFAGGLAAIGLIGAVVVWAKRRRLLRPRPIPVTDRYGEGDWFAVPLPKGAGFAPGLIARTEPRPRGLLLCYFFAPIGTAEPTLGQLRGLRAADAVLVQRLDGLAPKWPRLGRADGWDRGVWPVPAFGRFTKKTGQPYLDVYDDDLRFLGQEPTDHAEPNGLPPSELLSPDGAPLMLRNLQRELSGTVSVKRGGRMTCVECGAEMGTARRCRRCGAPVPERPQEEAPGTRPGSQKAAKPYKALLAWTVGGLLNIVALWMAIGSVGTAIIDPNYVPLWTGAFIASMASIVPAVSVIILVKRRRKRRAIATDSPELLPESLG